VKLRGVFLHSRIRPTRRQGGELRRINEAGDPLRRGQGEGEANDEG
jgi:hypothetical protein